MTSRVFSKVERLLEAGAASGTVLGLDTGSPLLSLGVVREGRIAAHLSRSFASHGASLAEAVDEVLAAAGIGIDQLDAVAVAIGPGSFTGLRIGVAYAKGLALFSPIALAGVLSLDALALTAHTAANPRPGTVICPLRDARRGEVYAALYRVLADGLERMTEDVVVPLEELVLRVEGEVLFAGDARAEDARLMALAQGKVAAVLREAELVLDGAVVAVLGSEKISCAGADRLSALEPLYLRPPDAAPISSNPNVRLSSGDRKDDAVWSAGKRNSYSSTRRTTRN